MHHPTSGCETRANPSFGTLVQSIWVAVRWIVLSDLHLGADQSVLTADDGVSPSATAVAMADCLRELVGDDRPTLVLAGDAIELALTQMAPAFTVFERFLELVHGDEPIIGDRIIYIPGNHDHHLWQVSRQQGYMRAIQETKPGDDLPAMWFTSSLDPDQDLPLSPLVALMRRDPRWQGVFVDAVYPNLALRRPGVERSVIVHHGHLVESIYSAMSRLGSLVFPTGPPDLRGTDRTGEQRLDRFSLVGTRTIRCGRDRPPPRLPPPGRPGVGAPPHRRCRRPSRGSVDQVADSAGPSALAGAPSDR
ncbi:MAG: hypothetical protein E4H05_05720 [Acidimicrobiales bacterium]|nr:MAG: hypothetical protein E4H05_05720 [Acidimicrobiales bacterium]